MDFYLLFAIELLGEKKYFKKIINSPFTYDESKERKEYYLINKSYMNEIYKIFHPVDIKEITDKNQRKNDNEMLDIIKKKYIL